MGVLHNPHHEGYSPPGSVQQLFPPAQEIAGKNQSECCWLVTFSIMIPNMDIRGVQAATVIQPLMKLICSHALLLQQDIVYLSNNGKQTADIRVCVWCVGVLRTITSMFVETQSSISSRSESEISTSWSAPTQHEVGIYAIWWGLFIECLYSCKRCKHILALFFCFCSLPTTFPRFSGILLENGNELQRNFRFGFPFKCFAPVSACIRKQGAKNVGLLGLRNFYMNKGMAKQFKHAITIWPIKAATQGSLLAHCLRSFLNFAWLRLNPPSRSKCWKTLWKFCMLNSPHLRCMGGFRK